VTLRELRRECRREFAADPLGVLGSARPPGASSNRVRTRSFDCRRPACARGHPGHEIAQLLPWSGAWAGGAKGAPGAAAGCEDSREDRMRV